jgi:hypothetical protein
MRPTEHLRIEHVVEQVLEVVEETALIEQHVIHGGTACAVRPGVEADELDARAVAELEDALGLVPDRPELRRTRLEQVREHRQRDVLDLLVGGRDVHDARAGANDGA